MKNRRFCAIFYSCFNTFSTLFILAVFMVSCGGASDSQYSGGSGQKSLGITLNFPETADSPAARNVSQANAARALPSYVTGVSLTISGEGMETAIVNIPLDSLTATVYLTNGTRKFDVLVSTNKGVSFTASVTAVIGGTSAPTLNFDLIVNMAPVINGLSASSSSVYKNTGISITASASDADGDPINYSWNGGGGSISGSGSSVTWSASKAGDYTIAVTADDGRGGTDTASTAVTVVNRAPVVSSVTADTTSPNVGHNVQLSCSATDADGDRLTYSWSDGKGWTASGAAAVYTVNSSGQITITCTADDGDRHGTATGSVTLNSAGGGTPTGVSATAGSGQATISWNAVSGATSYNIYWSTSTGVTTANGTKIAGVTSSYIHTGLSNRTTYYYIVTAVVGGVEGSASTQVSASPSPQAGVALIGFVTNGATQDIYSVDSGTGAATLIANVAALKSVNSYERQYVRSTNTHYIVGQNGAGQWAEFTVNTLTGASSSIIPAVFPGVLTRRNDGVLVGFTWTGQSTRTFDFATGATVTLAGPVAGITSFTPGLEDIDNSAGVFYFGGLIAGNALFTTNSTTGATTSLNIGYSLRKMFVRSDGALLGIVSGANFSLNSIDKNTGAATQIAAISNLGTLSQGQCAKDDAGNKAYCYGLDSAGGKAVFTIDLFTGANSYINIGVALNTIDVK